MRRRLVGGALAGANALALALGLGSAPALAQSSSAMADEAGPVIAVTTRDYEAARNVTARAIHTTGTARVEGRLNAPRTFKANAQGALAEISAGENSTTRAEAAIGAATASVPAFTGPGFYPDDLVQSSPPGPVITTARIFNVFINCTGACFATPWRANPPGVFLTNFLGSNFIHLLDQYTGSTQSGRYIFAGAIPTQYRIQSAQLNDASDISTIVHAAAASHGTGYNNIYNVFIPKGIDVCVSTTAGSQCFSPNNPANWFFCAYHSYVDFPDIGHVLYTVIPYPDQALVSNGIPYYVCDVGQTNPNADTTPTPNGVLADSVASFLDHELSETITDPDINAYLTQNSLASYLSEIGDVCVNPFFLYTPFTVSGTLYYIQPEYSNTYHACASVP
ncbi:MAG TPA: hypothetical protein VH278_11800 [Burkholderiaceae bacterium]|nr:hypothetical protein [Burkholderiaceae bacterium]